MKCEKKNLGSGIAANRRARFDYVFDEEYEAGKQDLIETTLDHLDRYVPNIRERVAHVVDRTARHTGRA